MTHGRMNAFQIFWRTLFPPNGDPERIAFGVFIVAVLVFCAVVLIWVIVSTNKRRAEVRRTLLEEKPIWADEFLANWRIGGRGSKLGYGATDESGCYVILTDPLVDGEGKLSYEAVYVGQSIHVAQRVRQHLTGHGNGDVYADVRAGKPVQVRIMRCPASELNKTEKSLIDAFNATSSYNRTKGGSKAR